MYFVYILTNDRNTVLYVGVTNDILRRVTQHKQKVIKGFTAKYNVSKLIYLEEFKYVDEAILAEKRIKGWTRRKKEDLINSFNPKWKELSF